MSEFSKLKQQRKAKEAKSYTSAYHAQPTFTIDSDIHSTCPILNSIDLYPSLPPVLDVRVNEEKPETGRGVYSKIHWKPGEKRKRKCRPLLLIVVQYKDRRRADLRWTPRRGSIKWQSRGILFQLLWSRIWAFTTLYRLQSDPVLWFCKSRHPYLLVFSFSSNFS